MNTPKPYNGGTWSKARMRSFVMSALRQARWGQKYASVKRAFVRDGINPATGRKCKLHRCEECGNLFPAGGMQADHIEPVVPLDGKWGDTTEYLGVNWNELIPRLYAEADHWQALDKECHKVKTQEERVARAEFKKRLVPDLFDTTKV